MICFPKKQLEAKKYCPNICSDALPSMKKGEPFDPPFRVFVKLNDYSATTSSTASITVSAASSAACWQQGFIMSKRAMMRFF